jgi:hypothetical protein
VLDESNKVSLNRTEVILSLFLVPFILEPLFIQAQDWAGTREKLIGLLDVLPAMVTPGTDLFDSEPATNSTG